MRRVEAVRRKAQGLKGGGGPGEEVGRVGAARLGTEGGRIGAAGGRVGAEGGRIGAARVGA